MPPKKELAELTTRQLVGDISIMTRVLNVTRLHRSLYTS